MPRVAKVSEVPGPGSEQLTLLVYDQPRSEICLLHVHGKGGDVLSGPPRWLPSLIPSLSHAAVNLRCRGLAWTRYDEPVVDLTRVDPQVEGGMWEDLDHSVLEVEAAVKAVREAGFSRIALVGHSSGGFFSTLASHVLSRSDLLVLLSPVTSNRRALEWWFPDAAERDETIDAARQAVAEGRGRTLVQLRRWYWQISAAAFVQRADELPDIWSLALARCPSPVMLIGGNGEPGATAWSSAASQLGAEWVELEDADHFYVGAEQRVAGEIERFVIANEGD